MCYYVLSLIQHLTSSCPFVLSPMISGLEDTRMHVELSPLWTNCGHLISHFTLYSRTSRTLASSSKFCSSEWRSAIETHANPGHMTSRARFSRPPTEQSSITTTDPVHKRKCQHTSRLIQRNIVCLPQLAPLQSPTTSPTTFL